MTEPLSDARLAEIRDRTPSVVCPAAHPGEADKGHVWVTGSLFGALRCSACHLSQRALGSDEAVLLVEVDRLGLESEQRLGELLFWHFEFQDAMDNYRGEAQHVKKLAAESESRRQAAAANAASAEVLQRQINEQASELDRLNGELQRIQRWASETVHGSAAAEVLLLIRDLPTAPAEPFRNCFTDEAYRSALTDSPEKPCDRVQPHPAHKHVAQRASWQCPGVAAAPSV